MTDFARRPAAQRIDRGRGGRIVECIMSGYLEACFDGVAAPTSAFADPLVRDGDTGDLRQSSGAAIKATNRVPVFFAEPGDYLQLAKIGAEFRPIYNYVTRYDLRWYDRNGNTLHLRRHTVAADHAVDSTGRVYSSAVSDGRRYDTDAVREISGQTTQGVSIAYDPAADELVTFLRSGANLAISRYELDYTPISEPSPSFGNGNNFVVDSGGEIAWATNTFTASELIGKYDAAGTLLWSAHPKFGAFIDLGSISLDVDSSGNLVFAAENFPGASTAYLQKWPSTGGSTPTWQIALPAPITSVSGLAVSPVDDSIVFVSNAGIYRYTSGGSAIWGPVPSTGSLLAINLYGEIINSGVQALDADGNQLWQHFHAGAPRALPDGWVCRAASAFLDGESEFI